jgi:hypothetical protein
MTMQTLYTTQTPGGNFNDGSSISLGTAIHFLTPGWVYGHRFYGHTDLDSGDFSGTYTGQFWEYILGEDSGGTGTRLAQRTYGAVTSGWNEILYSTPVPVDIDIPYKTVYHSSSGLYTAISNQFQTLGLVNGDVEAYASGSGSSVGTIRNATYFEPGATVDDFPKFTFNGGGYMSDVLFSTDPPETGAGRRFFLFC